MIFRNINDLSWCKITAAVVYCRQGLQLLSGLSFHAVSAFSWLQLSSTFAACCRLCSVASGHVRHQPESLEAAATIHERQFTAMSHIDIISSAYRIKINFSLYCNCKAYACSCIMCWRHTWSVALLAFFRWLIPASCFVTMSLPLPETPRPRKLRCCSIYKRT